MSIWCVWFVRVYREGIVEEEEGKFLDGIDCGLCGGNISTNGSP